MYNNITESITVPKMHGTLLSETFSTENVYRYGGTVPYCQKRLVPKMYTGTVPYCQKRLAPNLKRWNGNIWQEKTNKIQNIEQCLSKTSFFCSG